MILCAYRQQESRPYICYNTALMGPENLTEKDPSVLEEEPLCPYFGECGGCEYQDIPYLEELKVKKEKLQTLLLEDIHLEASLIQETVASPEPYHYRNRLDLSLRRSRGQMLAGFQVAGTKRMLEITSCAIAKKEISDFIPELIEQAKEKLPEKYRTATLVVKAGGHEKVLWGGIGRKSLRLSEEDYFWTEIKGKRIYYSLDTFFQANESILPSLMDTIENLIGFSKKDVFFDLYGGVGLFGVYFSGQVKQVVSVEEVGASTKVLDYNIKYHGLQNIKNISSRVEDVLADLLKQYAKDRKIAMIDPPRRGLSPEVLKVLVDAKDLEKLLYLSCHPESLKRDLKEFHQTGWKIKKIIPFDFFPKTKHIETLVLLEP